MLSFCPFKSLKLNDVQTTNHIVISFKAVAKNSAGVSVNVKSLLFLTMSNALYSAPIFCFLTFCYFITFTDSWIRLWAALLVAGFMYGYKWLFDSFYSFSQPLFTCQGIIVGMPSFSVKSRVQFKTNNRTQLKTVTFKSRVVCNHGYKLTCMYNYIQF